ncbi:hypothetical protein KAU33_00685, partial [Candidatus Dependentiae bacterium]|nr:hypothetical protein [Candidatus Dependentiae bacterium]
MSEYKVIGKDIPRYDAFYKATGSAQYIGDITFPGMLFGKVLRSPHPHAEILNLDVSKAEKLPALLAVTHA